MKTEILNSQVATACHGFPFSTWELLCFLGIAMDRSFFIVTFSPQILLLWAFQDSLHTAGLLERLLSRHRSVEAQEGLREMK